MIGTKSKSASTERMALAMHIEVAKNLLSGISKIDDSILVHAMTVVEYRTFKLFKEELDRTIKSDIKAL